MNNSMTKETMNSGSNLAIWRSLANPKKHFRTTQSPRELMRSKHIKKGQLANSKHTQSLAPDGNWRCRWVYWRSTSPRCRVTDVAWERCLLQSLLDDYSECSKQVLTPSYILFVVCSWNVMVVGNTSFSWYVRSTRTRHRWFMVKWEVAYRYGTLMITWAWISAAPCQSPTDFGRIVPSRTAPAKFWRRTRLKLGGNISLLHFKYIRVFMSDGHP